MNTDIAASPEQLAYREKLFSICKERVSDGSRTKYWAPCTLIATGRAYFKVTSLTCDPVTNKIRALDKVVQLESTPATNVHQMKRKDIQKKYSDVLDAKYPHTNITGSRPFKDRARADEYARARPGVEVWLLSTNGFTGSTWKLVAADHVSRSNKAKEKAREAAKQKGDTRPPKRKQMDSESDSDLA